MSSDDDEWLAGDLDERTRALRAAVATLTGRRCTACAAPLCGHGAVLAIVLGYKHEPRCARCVARELRETTASLAERSLQWIVRRDCFLHAWRAASRDEGHGEAERPPCVFTDATAAGAAAGPLVASAPPAAETYVDAASAASTYDAGDLGCGDLVLELRTQLRALPPGAVLRVIARDPAAPVDLPAWCGLTGHTLLSSDHPRYLIQRKRE